MGTPTGAACLLTRLASRGPWRVADSVQFARVLGFAYSTTTGAAQPSTSASDQFKPSVGSNHYYYPGRDVYREFERKWQQRLQPPTPRTLPSPQTEWFPEAEAAFLETLRTQGLLPTDAARTLLAHAKQRRAPHKAEAIVKALSGLKELEKRFFGFSAVETALTSPSLLYDDPSRVYSAMLAFQDNCTSASVGQCMPRLASLILDQPAQLARRLHTLEQVTRKLLGVTVPLELLDRQSKFLTRPPAQLEEAVEACRIIFGHEAAAELLSQHPNILNIPPQTLNESMLLLRSIISPQDRHYVTALVLRAPQLARLPERCSAEEIRGRWKQLKRGRNEAGKPVRLNSTEARKRLLEQPLLLLGGRSVVAGVLALEHTTGRQEALAGAINSRSNA